MLSVVVADASCLIVLHEVGALDLLIKLYEEVLITPEVALEFGNRLPEGFTIQSPEQKNTQQLLTIKLDPGEASSIALCMEHRHSLLIIDEKRGRKVARQLGISITGTLGVCLAAKESGHIPAVKPLIEAIAKTDFFVSEELLARILVMANELS